MLDEKTIEELHSYYDRLPGGICLVKADDSEEILLANAELLNYYQCANWQEFKELTGGTYRGMVEASDYIPLKDIVRVKGQRYSERQRHDRQHPLSGSERCVQDHQ